MIAVVEDEKELCESLKMLLTEKGYEIVTAGSCGEVDKYIGNPQIDMFLLDVKLPDGSGFDICRKIRKSSEVPVIFLTSCDNEEEIVMGLDIGADDYITKPFSSGYLRARISSLLKQRSILREHFMKEVLPVAGKEPVAIQGDALENLSPSVPQITSYDEEFIHKIIQAVEERLQDSDFKIEDLADSMNIGRSVFYKKVKSILGVSPIELVKDMRIKRAIQLLETGNYNISQIAYMSGFSSSQYFSRVFKELKNCTPSEYKIKN